MPLTKAQGLLISNDELLRSLMEDEAKRIQLAEVFPFFPINGDTLRVERVDTANFGADPKFDTVGVAPGEGVAVPQSTLEAKFELKMIVQDILVQDFTAFCQSNVNSQVGVQLEAATRRLLYVFWQKFGTGNETANPEEFRHGSKQSRFG